MQDREGSIKGDFTKRSAMLEFFVVGLARMLTFANFFEEAGIASEMTVVTFRKVFDSGFVERKSDHELTIAEILEELMARWCTRSLLLANGGKPENRLFTGYETA